MGACRRVDDLKIYYADRTITGHVEEDREVTKKGASLWDSAYKHHALIRKHLVQKSDEERLYKQSLFTLCKEQEAMATQMTVVLVISGEKIREIMDKVHELKKSVVNVTTYRQELEKKLKESLASERSTVDEATRLMTKSAISGCRPKPNGVFQGGGGWKIMDIEEDEVVEENEV
ncbi:hypothetical protein VNO78_18072 [Psophocarpus tetragonolobus]|uniref:Uncharacterized protein n=1 Tax=Psophocarpus tetragonolobus TaxID=3891 RepID=A0AAN9SHT1_PSOTE